MPVRNDEEHIHYLKVLRDDLAPYQSDIRREENIHYLKVLRDHCAPFQPEIRRAVCYAIGQLSLKDCHHKFRYQGEMPNTGIQICLYCGKEKDN